MQNIPWIQSWPDVLLNGSLRIVLPTLQIRQNGEIRYRGAGWLRWQHGNKVHVEAVTDGGPANLDGTVRYRYGELVPHEEYGAFEGTTQDGWHVSTTLWPLHDYSASTESQHLTWDLQTFGLQMSKPMSLEGDSCLTAILSPSFDRGTRYTTKTIESFQKNLLHSPDWLQVETSYGTLYAVRHSPDFFEVQISPSLEPEALNAECFLKAVTSAFTFLMGKRVHLLGYEFEQPQISRRTLRVPVRPIARGHLLKPFLNELEFTQLEGYLQKAIPFFMSERGEAAAGYLHLCWDSVDNDVLTKALNISVATEGLVRLAMNRKSQSDNHLKSKIERVSSFLHNEQAVLGESFVNRVKGCMSTFKNPRPKDHLVQWHSASLLDVRKEDITAWDTIRNPIAHAATVALPDDRIEKQQFLWNLQRIQSLINRIVLQLMEYEGLYTDYSQTHPSPARFPLAKLDQE